MQITRIFHSGFLVETAKRYFIFDYYKGELPKLNPDKPVYVFASHGHQDHYEIEADFLVDTFHSTDAGVAYLVTCGEGKIYHAGDLHDWVFDSASERENRQMTGMYRHEIDKMKNISLDVAFVPLDPRQERRYADGILYFLQKVKAKQVYPMHFWSHCSIIDKFLAEYPEYADVIKK